MTDSLCKCGHPMEPNHLTPGAECSQSGGPGGCGCVTYRAEPSSGSNREDIMRRSFGDACDI